MRYGEEDSKRHNGEISIFNRKDVMYHTLNHFYHLSEEHEYRETGCDWRDLF